MSRYIDADVLIDDLIHNRSFYPAMVASAIKNTPTADVVSVVRCKDCKYWQDNNGGYPHEECRWGKEETPDSDDYCSYGERK